MLGTPRARCPHPRAHRALRAPGATGGVPVPCVPWSALRALGHARSQRRGGPSSLPARHGVSAQPPRVTASHFVINRIVSARRARTGACPTSHRSLGGSAYVGMGLIRAKVWPCSHLSAEEEGEMSISTTLDVPPAALRPPRCSNTSHREAAGVRHPRVTSSKRSVEVAPPWAWSRLGCGSAVLPQCRAGSCGHRGPCGA